MSGKKSFDNSLKLTKSVLLLAGLKMYETKSRSIVDFFVKNCLFYFNCVWIYTDVSAELCWLIDGIRTGKSVLELSSIAPCITICLTSTAKSLSIYYYGDTFIKIVDKLREINPESKDHEEIEIENLTNNDDGPNDATNEGLDEVEEKIVKESLKLLNIIVSVLFYSTAFVAVIFALVPISVMAYKYFKTGELDIIFPFYAKYLFNPFSNWRWPFVYIHQVWSTVLTIASLCGPDAFFYAFCMFIKMHFRILCHRFETTKFPLSPQNGKQGKIKFHKLIKRHQELLDLVNEVQVLYSKSTLFHIITSSFIICLNGFNVIANLSDVSVVIQFLAFLQSSIAQIFILCYFGDMLFSSSSQVTEAIYNCNWYDADKSDKKSILFVLMRAQKPCKLSAAGFTELNLNTFALIMSRSYSYFALLRTAME